MSENCNQSCSSCSEDCADRKEQKTDFSEKLNDLIGIKEKACDKGMIELFDGNWLEPAAKILEKMEEKE